MFSFCCIAFSYVMGNYRQIFGSWFSGVHFKLYISPFHLFTFSLLHLSTTLHHSPPLSTTLHHSPTLSTLHSSHSTLLVLNFLVPLFLSLSSSQSLFSFFSLAFFSLFFLSFSLSLSLHSCYRACVWSTHGRRKDSVYITVLSKT